MDSTLKIKWVEALRSGEYPQAREFLRTEDGFCCLGVLCEIAELPEWDGTCVKGKDDHIPPDICRRIGLPYELLTGPDDDELIAMNDQGKTFSEIADYIERNF